LKREAFHSPPVRGRRDGATLSAEFEVRGAESTDGLSIDLLDGTTYRERRSLRRAKVGRTSEMGEIGSRNVRATGPRRATHFPSMPRFSRSSPGLGPNQTSKSVRAN
jgi:hypothetical protein